MDTKTAHIQKIVLDQLHRIPNSYDSSLSFDSEAERLDYVKNNCTTYKQAWIIFSALQDEYTGGHLTHYKYLELLGVLDSFENSADALAKDIIREGGLDD